jgi:hypothetical protein
MVIPARRCEFQLFLRPGQRCGCYNFESPSKSNPFALGLLMSVVRIQFGLFLLVVSCSLVWAVPAASTRKHAPVHPAAKHVEQPTQPAPAPPSPPTLEQMPAAPPHVEYSHGELTIVAENSTLGDILRAVRDQTGAKVEIPAGATERVVIHLGPGPARQVMADLLNGTRFNYVMLGSATNPGALQEVILTLKPPAPPAGSNPTLASQPPMQRGQFAAPGNSDNADSADDDSDDSSDNPPDDQASPAPTPQQPAVKSPQQMLEDLQRQLQQQQMQQQGAPAPGETPPQQIQRHDQ